MKERNEKTDSFIKIGGTEYHFETTEADEIPAEDVLNGMSIHCVCPCCGGDAIWKKKERGHSHLVCNSCGATYIE